VPEPDASTSDEIAVEHLNDVVTRIGGTYCVSMGASYVTGIGRSADGQIGVTVHMTEDQARDLCGGLKDALR
jgi:predicted SpoU family rRNA methylase